MHQLMSKAKLGFPGYDANRLRLDCREAQAKAVDTEDMLALGLLGPHGLPPLSFS